jgi:hypothetical protein
MSFSTGLSRISLSYAVDSKTSLVDLVGKFNHPHRYDYKSRCAVNSPVVPIPALRQPNMS